MSQNIVTGRKPMLKYWMVFLGTTLENTGTYTCSGMYKTYLFENEVELIVLHKMSEN